VGNYPLVGNGGVAKWGMTGRTVEPLLRKPLLQNIYVLNTSWVKIDFVKDRCCGGIWRVGPLKCGELEKKG